MLSGLLSSLAPLLLGALAKFALAWLSDKRNEGNQRTIGRLVAERDQALAGKALAERMGGIAARPPLGLKGLADALRREAGS